MPLLNGIPRPSWVRGEGADGTHGCLLPMSWQGGLIALQPQCAQIKLTCFPSCLGQNRATKEKNKDSRCQTFISMSVIN